MFVSRYLSIPFTFGNQFACKQHHERKRSKEIDIQIGREGGEAIEWEKENVSDEIKSKTDSIRLQVFLKMWYKKLGYVFTVFELESIVVWIMVSCSLFVCISL